MENTINVYKNKISIKVNQTKKLQNMQNPTGKIIELPNLLHNRCSFYLHVHKGRSPYQIRLSNFSTLASLTLDSVVRVAVCCLMWL